MLKGEVCEVPIASLPARKRTFVTVPSVSLASTEIVISTGVVKTEPFVGEMI